MSMLLESIAEELNHILNVIDEFHTRYRAPLADVAASNRHRAWNLVDYIAFRSEDRSLLQQCLAQLGLSSLGRCEAAIKPQLERVQSLVAKLMDQSVDLNRLFQEDPVAKGRQLLEANSDALFGAAPQGRHTRIMVTMATEMAYDLDTVKRLLEAGMDVARINCAHDDARVWRRIADNVRRASGDTGLPCSVLMDLAGPKLRTGAMPAGVKVIKVKPLRNNRGQMVKPGKVLLYCRDLIARPGNDAVAVPLQIDTGCLPSGIRQILVTDTRGKHRKLTVLEQTEGSLLVSLPATTYFETGQPLLLAGTHQTLTIPVGELMTREGYLALQAGDRIKLVARDCVATPPILDSAGNLLQPAMVSCGVPEALEAPDIGHRVKLDDGKFTGSVVGKGEGWLLVDIQEAPVSGGKLRAEKGINFPDTDLPVAGLTRKDIEDLDAVCDIADLIALSFVNSPQDVDDLIRELKLRRKDSALGIILKVETLRAFNNLPELLLSAMQVQKVGVMIARGDLGVEVGWRQMAEIQEEVLWLCAAAHIPSIWATQVLETLTKSGQPTRSEITDAAMAQRAECIMLNKGPYIVKSVKMLSRIIRTMDARQYKKAARLPRLACQYNRVVRAEPVGEGAG